MGIELTVSAKELGHLSTREVAATLIMKMVTLEYFHLVSRIYHL